MDAMDAFVQLASRYDDPKAVPSLPEILRLMISAEEAGVLMGLPGTLEQVRFRVARPAALVRGVLTKCYRNGLILKRKDAKRQARSCSGCAVICWARRLNGAPALL